MNLKKIRNALFSFFFEKKVSIKFNFVNFRDFKDIHELFTRLLVALVSNKPIGKLCRIE